MPENTRNPWTLLAFCLIVVLAALAGGVSWPGVWYESANRSGWMVSGGTLIAVWCVCYGLIALAGWRLWINRVLPGAHTGLGAWGIQLLLNVGWALIFFEIARPGWALPLVAMLWLAVVACLVLFSRVSRPAAMLMLPYLAWVSYLAVLNFQFWRIN